MIRKCQQSDSIRQRRGFTMLELLVALGLISILLSLLLPAVQQARERARGTECINHLRQIVAAAQTHEAAHRRFPHTSTLWLRPINGDIHQLERRNSVSPFRDLALILDEPVGRQIDWQDPTSSGFTKSPPSHGNSPPNQQLLQFTIPWLICPSDRSFPGTTSYRANLGVSTAIFKHVEEDANRGAFENDRPLSSGAFVDGLSQTAFFSERVIGDRDPDSYSPMQDVAEVGPNSPLTLTSELRRRCETEVSWHPDFEYSFAGQSWLLGGFLHTWYLHVLPPNSDIPDCAVGRGFVDGGEVIMTPRSLHPGGVHVGFGDGAVKLVADEIDEQVWRELGTRDDRLHVGL